MQRSNRNSALLSRCAILGTVIFGAAKHSNAAVIISDSYTGTNDTSLATHAPNVDTVSSPTGYTLGTFAGEGADIYNNSAAFGGNGSHIVFSTYPTSAVLPFGNSFTVPTSVSISADLVEGTTVAATGIRGFGLGFYSVPTGSNGNVYADFDGLVLTPTGSLELVTNSGATVSAPVAFGGTFSPTTADNLSYTINTATGAITGITLAGSTADYSSLESTSVFSGADLNYVGFIHASSQSSSIQASLDNFKVSSVPEPTSLCVLGFVGAGLLGRRRSAVRSA